MALADQIEKFKQVLDRIRQGVRQAKQESEKKGPEESTDEGRDLSAALASVRAGKNHDQEPYDLKVVLGQVRQDFMNPSPQEMMAAKKVFCGAGQPSLLQGHWQHHQRIRQGRESPSHVEHRRRIAV